MFPSINFLIEDTPSTQCLAGFICANETFISIYGVIFTLLISLAVYIYGLENESKRTVLISDSEIGQIIRDSIVCFSVCFLAIGPLYSFVNFVLLAYLLLKIRDAFKCVVNFNKDELSAEQAVAKYKHRIIFEKLKSFRDIEIRNKEISSFLDKKGVERILFEDDLKNYDVIRSKKKGYIEEINFENFFTRTINTDLKSENDKQYYIPFQIAVGNQVKFDDVLIGIKKTEKDGMSTSTSYDERKILSAISITDSIGPGDYLGAETQSFFQEMFQFISQQNFKSLEHKLEDFSKFVDLVVVKPDEYTDIVQFINDNTILPLQKHAFKIGDFDTLRKITAFSLQYSYKTIHENLNKSFKIFFRNLNLAFYESFNIKKIETRNSFYEMFFRWLHELSRYSIIPKLERGDVSYQNYALDILSVYNSMLKIAYDKKDIKIFELTLDSLNNSFSKESYHLDENGDVELVIKNKKAVIFGFTSWLYKYYDVRKNEDFYKSILNKLLSTLTKDRNFVDRLDNLNYYISVYLRTSAISKDRNLDSISFGWESWDAPEGVVYSITIDSDLKKLLIDRLIYVFISEPNIVINIQEGNYDQDLSTLKKNSQFDILKEKTPDSFFASSGLSLEKFDSVREAVYSTIEVINKKYEEDEKSNLIKQPLDEEKFNKFTIENIKSYQSSRVLNRIGKFVQNPIIQNEFFGYSTLLNKEQFVKKTNVHYVNQDEYGESLSRAEDNKILEKIIEKNKSGIKDINTKNLIEYLSFSNFDFIVIWTKNNFNLEQYDSGGKFKPYWLEEKKRTKDGLYYQGSIDKKKVYTVYQPENQERYKDTIFLFNANAFLIKEFKPDVEAWEDKGDILTAEMSDNSLFLQVKGLSNSENDRKSIIKKSMKNKKIEEVDGSVKDEELKTKVVLKFFKALDVESIKLNEDDVEIIRVN